MAVAVEPARLGRAKALVPPLKSSDPSGKVAAGAPVDGQHTREALREPVFSTAVLEALLTE